MSESDGEQAARSVALEQAYVHEVYEQCAEKTAQSRHWPRIYKFLEELEPGALVCDIGCGNGKYLSVNDNVFKVGADRCKRLTDIAREKENEVLICDNLALPFRDESFDAVLSIAVVHHFATTERRVNALKELARVLRIGGRLVISVWAMEQRHRKFESQDVLVPWPKAYCLNTGSGSGYPGGKLSTGGIPCINEHDPNRFAQKSPLTSKRVASRKCKKRSYWIDPIFSPSPSTSSLSSPNETCYSFFRRALQKLAGGKRDSGNRAWFLETWQNGDCKNRRNFEIDDIGDVDDIPIELRRLEDDNVTVTKLPDGQSVKSKSLGDILEVQRLDLVRSRSSIPGFSSSLTSEFYLDEESKAPSPLISEEPNPAYRITPSVESVKNAEDPELLPSWSSVSPPHLAASAAPIASASPVLSSSIQSLSGSFSSNSKPRLVKQKSHLPDDASLEFPDKSKNTAIQEFIEGTGEFQSARPKRGNVHKQSSMNEELMSMERLLERDRVRRNIMKQASLNEEIICKPGRTFGNFRDTLYSGNATKRFQLIKSGLTNRIKQSTTSMEKVSSMALKNGFVKILQGWKSGESNVDASDSDGDESKRCKELSSQRKTSTTVPANGVTANTIGPAPSAGGGKPEVETIERRLSKEDGSDSSKDSSLQSDTSVDSEDSFASVIYVPKQPQQQHHHNYQHHQNAHQLHYDHQFPSLVDVATVPVGGYQLRTTSAPPSPRIKHPPEIYGPRLKLISISPLLKQFPATSKSLPPPSPPGLSPRTFNLFGPPSSAPSVNLPENTTTVKSMQHDTIKIDAMNKINTDMNVNENLGENNRSDVTKLVDANGIKEESSTNDMALGQTETDETIEARTSDVDDTQTDRTPSRIYSLVVGKVTEQDNKNISANVEVVDGQVCTVYNNSMTLRPVQRTNNDADLSVKSMAPLVDFSIGTGGDLGDNQSEKSKSGSSESISEEDSRGSRLKQIKELLKQKPGFATRCGKSAFPLVRRASTVTSGRSEMVDARTLPRLLSLELFNPETDDLDSDSSGLSSPESVGSVISVISDERFALKNKDKNGGPDVKKVYIEGTTRCDQTSSYYEQIDESQSLRLLDAATGASSTNPLPASVVSSAIPYKNGHDTHGQTDPISVNGHDNSRRQDVDDKFEENVINDNEKCYGSERISQVPIDSARGRSDTTRVTSTHRRLSETSLIERYDASLTPTCAPENAIDLSSRINNCKYSQLMDDTIAWLRSATGPDNDYHYSEYTDNNSRCTAHEKGSIERDESPEFKSSLSNSTSEDMMDFVMVTKNGECIGGTDIGTGSDGDEEARSTVDTCHPTNNLADYTTKADIAGGTGTSNIGPPSAVDVVTVRHGNSHESMEIEGSISRSSDATSQTGSINTSRFCGSSTTCLVSNNLDYKSLRERRKHLYQNRSASEEISASSVSPSMITRMMDDHCDGAEARVDRESRKSERYANSLKSANMSGSSSQESLLSDYGGDGFGDGGNGGGGGGAITYHQYYHVFREGELDQLINKYVENLHIISSYYDHASWCIVAEKVQVWTI